ncbi:MAG TPA: ring-cleaving dioxygenase [Acidobacteriaceae bacterium]
MKPIVGLHHVTAITSNPQRNLDFYTQVLGLRFVKRTVNFDDPGSYHFYFGDDLGSPGTILTFFAWPGAPRGVLGTGETAATGFEVPPGSIDFWERHLRSEGLAVLRTERFDQVVLSFADPDGMQLEMVGRPQATEATDVRESAAPRFSPIEARHALRGFAGVTLHEQAVEKTAAVLATMGFAPVAQQGTRFRFAAQGHASGNCIDVLAPQPGTSGRLGAGSVHHIAFRAADDASQLEWRERLLEQGLSVTPVQERTYFRSIYYREPGGVLFELATDPPGFALDEPLESLGESLKLPPWLESKRPMIERQLPTIELRKAATPAGEKTL